MRKTAPQSGMPLNLENKVAAGFGVALALVVVIGVISYRSTVQMTEDADWVKYTQDVGRSLTHLALVVDEMSDGSCPLSRWFGRSEVLSSSCGISWDDLFPVPVSFRRIKVAKLVLHILGEWLNRPRGFIQATDPPQKREEWAPANSRVPDTNQSNSANSFIGQQCRELEQNLFGRQPDKKMGARKKPSALLFTARQLQSR